MAKINLNDLHIAKAEKYYKTAGYSSAAELIEHAIDKLVEDYEDDADAEELAKSLKGLGYID